MAQAAGPSVCSALFALSIDGDRPFPFDYHFIFYFIALLRLLVGYIGWNVVVVEDAVESTPTPVGDAPEDMDDTVI